MNIRLASKTLVPLAFVLASSVAGAACVPVIGTVKLLPLATGCAALAPVGGVPFLGQCFGVRLALAGLPVATGYAGPTSEPIVGTSPLTGALTPIVTPAAIPVSATVPMPRQSIQTARSAVTLGSGRHATTLYSNDVIVAVMQPGADGQPVPVGVTEQIVIVGSDGKGAYSNVTGMLTVAGNSIGVPAPVSGQLCLP